MKWMRIRNPERKYGTWYALKKYILRILFIVLWIQMILIASGLQSYQDRFDPWLYFSLFGSGSVSYIPLDLDPYPATLSLIINGKIWDILIIFMYYFQSFEHFQIFKRSFLCHVKAGIRIWIWNLDETYTGIRIRIYNIRIHNTGPKAPCFSFCDLYKLINI